MNTLKSSICLMVIGAGALLASFHLGANNSQPRTNPVLMNTCLITADVNGLSRESVPMSAAARPKDHTAHIPT